MLTPNTSDDTNIEQQGGIGDDDGSIQSFHFPSRAELRSRRNNQQQYSSWGYFGNEWKLPMFALRESPDKLIDVQGTFAPCSKRILYGVTKTILLGWTISVVVMDKDRYDHTPFWLRNLSRWSLLSIMICNALNLSLFLHLCNQDRYPRSASAGCIVIIPWIVSIITINIGFLLMILYWILVHDGYTYTSYFTVMKYGLLAFLTAIDVICIKRIPMRLKQIIFVYLFQNAYFAWSLIRYGLGDDDDDNDYDYYGSYSDTGWRKKPLSGAIVAIVLTPILYFFLWSISLVFETRYCDTNGYETDEESHIDDEEDDCIDFTCTKLDNKIVEDEDF